MRFDYVLEVYYGEKFIITLGARHCGGYDNVVWYEVKDFIDSFKDKEITKKNILEYINNTETYFYECDSKTYTKIDKIDFGNKTITTPTKPVYTIEEFKEAWDGYIELLEVDNKLCVKYDDDSVYPLKNVTFCDETLFYKDELTFDEFEILYNFYWNLQKEDNEFLLNNKKIIKFNIV